MVRTGPWLWVFGALLLAIAPPFGLFLGAIAVSDSLTGRRDWGLIVAIVGGGSVAWAGVLAIVYARAWSENIRSLLTIAQRGADRDDGASTDAVSRLTTSLDERDRQVAALAVETSRIPIDDAPASVVPAVVATVRSVMRDATWRCAVLTSDAEDMLPPGIYHGVEDASAPEPIGDLERWAAVSVGERRAGRSEGPWGAFTVVTVPGVVGFRAILYAPWEGRPAPSPAEVNLLTLVGQHASTAIEHSLLYATAQRQADELSRMSMIQKDFLRGVTHDLQTPLTSIGALATELRADGDLPSTARDDLESIGYQADRLRRMVSQLLVASRLEAGVVSPRQEAFAIAPVVERTWEAMRIDRPFELTVVGEPHLAIADPDRLEQVLWALLDNAVKYSPTGTPVSVRIEPGAEGLSVTISDEGIGMDSPTADHAFDQFYRAEPAQRLSPDGSGVGLYAARGLVEAMGGSIRVVSALGRGTAMTIRVPAESASPE